MDVSKLYERAQSALERSNLDYAVDLFRQILAIEPNFVVARKAIRAVQRRKVQQDGFPAPAKILGILKGLSPLVKMAIYKLTKNYEAMMIECEKFLVAYPTHLGVIACLGNAAKLARYNDSAIACYEAVVELKADHIIALKHLGRLYAAKNDVRKAQHYYDEVKKHDPTDSEADKAGKDLAALGTIQKGWDQAGSFRDVVKDEEEAKKLEDDQRVVRTAEDVEKALARTKEDLKKEPDNPRLLGRLGDLLARKNEFDEARKAYEKAREVDPADVTLKTRLGDLEIQCRGVEIKKIETQLGENPDDAALKQRLTAMKQERLQFTLKEYERRVAEHPTDLGLHMEYGKLLYNAGKLDEAVTEFQRSVDSPKHRKVSLNLLGQSFMKKGIYDLAVAQFEKAMSEITVLDDDAKNLLYSVGTAHEQLGNLDKASDYFKRIYEADIGFKDVSEKIEALYKKTMEKEETTSADE